MAEHNYKREELINLLDKIKDRTLGEVDKANVFERAINNPKITGIAGDVIEQSVFGYLPDTKQEPDLNIDGVQTELKTTGIRISKNADIKYEAKEPLSVTAVSPEKIKNEEFYTSKFWDKIAHLLFVYYIYDSNKTVKAIDYANFKIKGYQFYEFDSEEVEILKNDWTIVRDFIRRVDIEGLDKEIEYPKISKLRNQCLMLDTAPKYPHNPRFRLKRSVVSNIYQKKFGDALEELPKEYTSFSEIDRECYDLTEHFKGMSIKDISETLQIKGDLNNKAIAQIITVKMFGGQSKKMSDVDIFNKFGLIGKTIVLSSKGGRTEDMKLFHIDFEEISKKEIIDEESGLLREFTFEDSSIYSYFSNYEFLCIVFKEPEKKIGEKIPLSENMFVGFERISFSDDFIYTKVKKLWDDTRDKILNNKLVDVKQIDNNGNQIHLKSGGFSSAPNFLKSADNDVFIRGSGIDSSSKYKSETVNGVKMLPQYVWIKGKSIVDMLSIKDDEFRS